MPTRIIITDGNWSADTKIFVPRGTLPQTLDGLTNGTDYTVSNTATSGVVTPVGPVELWEPSDMTTIVAWWDASDPATMTLTSGNVSSWRDKVAGIDVAQATAANRPGYSATARNGKPGVIFNGTRWLSAPSQGPLPIGTSAETIMVSGFANETLATACSVSWGQQGTRGNWVSIASGTASVYPVLNQSGQNDPATAFWNNRDRCIVYTRTAGATGTFTFTFDGTDATGNNGGAGGAGASYFKSVQAGPVSLGNSPNANLAPSNMILQQVVVCSAAITPTERQKLEGWESWKTGKNGSNLPAGHPYKSAAPTKDAILPNQGTILFAGDSMMEKSHVYAQQIASELGFTNFLLEGDGGIRWEQWAGKMGSRPWQFTFPSNTIPATGSVVVSSVNQGTGANNVIPFYGKASDVEGRVSVASNNVTFLRTTAGEAVVLSGSVPFIPDLAAQAKVVPSVQWIGTNNLRFGESGEALAQAIDDFVAWRTAPAGKVIVMGTFNATGTPAEDYRRTQTTAANTRLAATYGDHFIDVIEWLLNDAFAEMGRTPTEADNAEMALGNLPPSASTDGLHLNDAWYGALFRSRVKEKVEDFLLAQPIPA